MELRTWRKDRSMRLHQLSKDTGIPVSSLSRIERGAQWPTAEQALAIAAATAGQVSADDLAAFFARTKAAQVGQGAAAE